MNAAEPRSVFSVCSVRFVLLALQFGDERAITAPEYGLAPGYHFEPRVAAWEDGALAVWSDPRQGGSVYGARIAPDGTLLDRFGILIDSNAGVGDIIWTGRAYLLVYTTGSDLWSLRPSCTAASSTRTAIFPLLYFWTLISLGLVPDSHLANLVLQLTGAATLVSLMWRKGKSNSWFGAVGGASRALVREDSASLAGLPCQNETRLVGSRTNSIMSTNSSRIVFSSIPTFDAFDPKRISSSAPSVK